jgi:hypothetical protein
MPILFPYANWTHRPCHLACQVIAKRFPEERICAPIKILKPTKYPTIHYRLQSHRPRCGSRRRETRIPPINSKLVFRTPTFELKARTLDLFAAKLVFGPEIFLFRTRTSELFAPLLQQKAGTLQPVTPMFVFEGRNREFGTQTSRLLRAILAFLMNRTNRQLKSSGFLFRKS